MAKPTPNSVDLLFPDKYLKASHIAGTDTTVTITNVTVEDLTMTGGKHTDNSVVLTFEKATEQMIANKTNCYAIAVLLDTTDPLKWIGKRITLTTNKDIKMGMDSMALRVKTTHDAAPRAKALYERFWRGNGTNSARQGGQLRARLKTIVDDMVTRQKIQKKAEQARKIRTSSPSTGDNTPDRRANMPETAETLQCKSENTTQ